MGELEMGLDFRSRTVFTALVYLRNEARSAEKQVREGQGRVVDDIQSSVLVQSSTNQQHK